VMFQANFRKKTLSKNNSELSSRIKKIFRLPFSRFHWVAKLNDVLAKIYLSSCVAEMDVLWVTHPSMYQLVRDNFADDIRVVYDCMDDVLEFPDALANPKKLRYLTDLEAALCHRANIIFSSSSFLGDKLVARYGCAEKISIVQNALTQRLFDEPAQFTDLPDSLRVFKEVKGLKILYVGTISSWFDFESIVAILDQFEAITFVLIGPSETVSPAHDRLIVLPPVDHEFVLGLMRSADALIMPFLVTELVRSVNPVKLYEYIYAGKPAISVWYEEVQMFQNYVYTYRSFEELCGYIQSLIDGALSPKSSPEDSLAFVRDNTWETRILTMLARMESL
jgi:teichuronic acid biosynthesis glycosyltransferase TuaH